MTTKFIPYGAPLWANGLRHIPQSFIKLACRPTPIDEWALPGCSSEFKVFIKRDDLTGSTLTGNKVRKLEFIMAEALKTTCKHIITCGSLQSNHCRAVAVCCAQLGLKCHLFLRTDITNKQDLTFEGNLFLDKILGSDLYFIPKKTSYVTDIKPRMSKLSDKIQDDTGEKSLLVPVGGSDVIGVWGYIECFNEILSQGVDIDDIVCVCGSGGTAAGLAIANHLAGSPYRIHGVSICDSPDYFYNHINEMLDLLGVAGVRSEDIITIHGDYKGLGYGINRPFEFEFMSQVMLHTGVMLDNTYTGKGAYGLRDLLLNKPHVFKGKRILFIHSGGVFSLHTEQMASSLLPYTSKNTVEFLFAS